MATTTKIERVLATVIAVLNRKGGVAKTTTVEILGYILRVVFEKRVLLVETDSQANFTRGQGYDPPELEERGLSLGHVFLGETNVRDAILKTKGKPDLLPASGNLKAVEETLIKTNAPVTQLRDLLEEVRPDYDYILIDGPPSFLHVTESAMVAAGVMIVPQPTKPKDMEGRCLPCKITACS